MKYLIDYGTGAGNFELEGTLNEAMAEAEKGIAYTQQPIEIYDADEWRDTTTSRPADPVAILPWYGVEADEEDVVTANFNSFGFYGEWLIPAIVIAVWGIGREIKRLWKNNTEESENDRTI